MGTFHNESNAIAFINSIGIRSFLIELKVHVGSMKMGGGISNTEGRYVDIREGKGRAVEAVLIKHLLQQQ